MNAIREKCEASVLTDEAIEVHLSYLRPAVEAVQARLLVVQEEIVAVDKRLSEKIDKLAEQSMKIQASQDGLKWFIGSLALLASGISIAHSLEWI
jgi:VIT1/CCC1 family predicted Fe2+/Mn2+ transporter